MTTVEKILHYLTHKNISKREFYRITGISNGFLDKTKNIGSDNLAKIFTVYKDLSKDWLIMDEGEMIIKSNEPWNYHLFKETFPVQEPKGEYNLQEDKCTSCKEKDKTILAQQVTIEALQQTSKVQNELIDDLKEKISALSSKSEQ